MKTILLLVTLLPSIAFAGGCRINTQNLHDNDTSGTAKVERILRARGYEVVPRYDPSAEYGIYMIYRGNGVDKGLGLIISNVSEQKAVFNGYVEYKTPFGIEGTIFERIQVLKLAKNIPECPQ